MSVPNDYYTRVEQFLSFLAGAAAELPQQLSQEPRLDQFLRYLAVNGTAAEREILAALPYKADLVDGFVPASQIAGQYLITSAVDTYADLPAQGNPNYIYIVRDENNQQYRWDGTGYIKAGEKDAYYVAEAVGLTTMGQLRQFIEGINTQQLHVLLDMHTYVTDAYVCTAHFYVTGSVQHCEIFDLLNRQVIADATGFADTDTIASYVAANKHKIVTDADTETWTFTLADSTTVTKKVVVLP